MNLNKLLTIIASALIILIIFTSAILITSNKAKPGAGLEKIDSEATNKTSFKPAYSGYIPPALTYTKIGQLRISTKADSGKNGTIIILTPFLQYTDNDSSFYEELISKTSAIRQLISDYFSVLTISQINQKGEDLIKKELLDKINSILVLQQASAVLFNEYQFL